MRVVFADTDIFILLSYHIVNCNWSDAEVYLGEVSSVKATTSIKKTVLAHINVFPSLLAVHAVTGCDSVSRMCGIGKEKSISVAK